MIVPRYWAEGRVHQPRRGRDGRQITVRRWGWSDESQAAAQRHANQRASEAFRRVLAGEKLPRREPKAAYNGAEGVPIREEIVARHGDSIITRNAYGALCLNTPRVLFADIDFPTSVGLVTGCLGSLAQGVAVGLLARQLGLGHFAWFAAVIACFAGVWTVNLWAALLREARGGAEAQARQRVMDFLARHPHWLVRLYRTPAGLRVLVMHDLFDPTGEVAHRFMRSLDSDRVYAVMCRRQACFRARVSPKPWRIGMAWHIKPRTAVWPIAPEKVPARDAWITEYEQAAEGYASCRYLDSLGEGVPNPQADEVRRLHDELCRATSDLPIA